MAQERFNAIAVISILKLKGQIKKFEIDKTIDIFKRKRLDELNLTVNY